MTTGVVGPHRRPTAPDARRTGSPWRTPTSPLVLRGGGGPLLVDDLATWLTGVLDDARRWERAAGRGGAAGRPSWSTPCARRPGRVVLVSRRGRARGRAGDPRRAVVPRRARRAERRARGGLRRGAAAGGRAAAAAEVTRCESPAGVTTGGDRPRPAGRKGRWISPPSSRRTPTPVAPRSPGTASWPCAAGALGRLAELGCWLAATQGRCPPRPPGRPRAVVVAADHGIAAAGVSAHPAGTHAAAGAGGPRAHGAGGRAGHRWPASRSGWWTSASTHDSPDAAPHPALERAHRPGGRTDRRRGRARVRDRPGARRRGGRRRGRPAGAGVTRRRRHDAGIGAGRRPDRHRAGRRDRPGQRDRRRRLDAQGRRGPRRAAPGGPAPATTRWHCCGWPAAPTWPCWPDSARRPRSAAPRCCSTGWSWGPRRWSPTRWPPGRASGGCVAQRSAEPAMALLVERMQLRPVLDLDIRLGDGTGATDRRAAAA